VNNSSLKACRQRAEAALQTAAERISGASQEGPRISYFDWETPAPATPHLLTFLATVRFAEGERSFRVPIDIAKLAAEGRAADLEKLHAILSARHAGLDDRYTLLQALEWLLAISLEQAESQLSPTERQLQVRRLLLIESSFAEKQEGQTSKS
jgi:hypothetical protein